MKFVLFAIAITIGFGLYVQSDNDSGGANVRSSKIKYEPAQKVSPANKISPHAIYPVDAESYPKLAKKVGADGIDQINAMMRPAALKVAESSKCNKVEVVGVSDRTTSADNLTLYVDCANMERYYITQSDLVMPNHTLVTQSEKAQSISDVEAIRLCESEIKPELSRPNTFDRGIMSTSVQRHKTTGNLTVRFPFESSNKLDMALKFEATCVVSGPTTADVVINEL